MKIKLFIIGILLNLSPQNLLANDDFTTVLLNGKEVQARLLENGLLQFYTIVFYEERAVETADNYYQIEKIPINRFFLGKGLVVEEITTSNYKKLIEKYMPNAPDLHQRLGKLGFRYENVQQMVSFYNKFRADTLPDYLALAKK